jgi:hypothetical protein
MRDFMKFFLSLFKKFFKKSLDFSWILFFENDYNEKEN